MYSSTESDIAARLNSDDRHIATETVNVHLMYTTVRVVDDRRTSTSNPAKTTTDERMVDEAQRFSADVGHQIRELVRHDQQVLRVAFLMRQTSNQLTLIISRQHVRQMSIVLAWAIQITT